MYNIEFYKNDNLISMESNSVEYIDEEIKIIRETSEYLIFLDFINKTCSLNLKKENITVYINVLEMTYLTIQNEIILTYILESEPDVKNTLKVKKIDA